MDAEFENDTFADVLDNVGNRMRNERGESSAGPSLNASFSNQLNPQLACPIASITPYSNKW